VTDLVNLRSAHILLPVSHKNGGSGQSLYRCSLRAHMRMASTCAPYYACEVFLQWLRIYAEQTCSSQAWSYSVDLQKHKRRVNNYWVLWKVPRRDRTPYSLMYKFPHLCNYNATGFWYYGLCTFPHHLNNWPLQWADSLSEIQNPTSRCKTMLALEGKHK
jgi:hypothetical protein